MIIWKGNGIAVPVVAFLSMLGLDYFTGRANGAGYYSSHVWPKFAAFAIAAALVFWLVRATESTSDGDDHFFFIPLRFWPAILLIGGAILSFAITDSGAASQSTATETTTTSSISIRVSGTLACEAARS